MGLTRNTPGVHVATFQHVPHTTTFHADAVTLLAFVAGFLLTIAAWGGITNPATYAQETASWSAQATGQDWVNLLLLAPLLFAASWAAATGSRRATLLQGGLLAYVVYSSVIYAVGVHFNGLFLIYCALLGTSFYGLITLIKRALEDNVQTWFREDAPVKTAGTLQLLLAFMFAALWLAEDVPALLEGRTPSSLAEVGLVTNPVHVLDLSLALPALAVSGLALMQRKPLGYLLSPIMLAFCAAMTTAMAGMVWFMVQDGVALETGPILAMAGSAVACTAVLLWMLRCVRPRS